MAAHVQNATAAINDASGTSMNISFPVAVTAGSLVCLAVSWEGTATTLSCASDGGLTAGTIQTHSNNDLNLQLLFKLASGGNTTYAISWASGRPFRKALGMEFSYSGTLSLETQIATGQGTNDNTTVSSGNFTTAMTDGVVIGLNAAYTSVGANTAHQINAVNAAGVSTTNNAWSIWYRLPTSGFTGAATYTLPNLGAGQAWICNGAAFSVGGGAVIDPGIIANSGFCIPGEAIIFSKLRMPRFTNRFARFIRRALNPYGINRRQALTA